MNWRKKNITKYLKEALMLSLFVIVYTLILIIANHFFGWNFDWKDIDYIEQPVPLIRIFYSGLAYISIGAILYCIGFYYGLYQIFGVFLGNYKLYKDIKKIIWIGNILIMYFIIVPGIINVLNFIISLFLNSYQFFLQSLPLLALSFGITWIILGSYFHVTKKKPFVINNK